MENKLGQLLNTLIQRGWKPFGKRDKLYAVEDGIYIFGRIASDWNTYDLRQITSKESGLWQFVCENNLVPIMCDEEWIKHYYKDIDDDNLISGENIQPTTEYEYRLIESALKDESELEDFLLNSISLHE